MVSSGVGSNARTYRQLCQETEQATTTKISHQLEERSQIGHEGFTWTACGVWTRGASPAHGGKLPLRSSAVKFPNKINYTYTKNHGGGKTCVALFIL